MVTPTLRVQEKVYLMAIKKPRWELLFTSYHLNAQTSGQRTFQLECFPSEKKIASLLSSREEALKKSFCEDVNMQPSRGEDH